MKQEMIVTFSGDLRVDAEYNDFIIRTDQPKSNGGDNSAPTPFNLFLASIGTCAGIYIIFFCKKRRIPYKNIRLIINTEKNENNKTRKKFWIDIQLPPNFPDKYRNAIIRSANLCTVKKTIEANPEFIVTTSKF
ncbi:OsmC family protein [[Eubacterium] cellulosolvens]